MENLTLPQKIFLFSLGIIVIIILVVYVFTKDNSTFYFDNNFEQEEIISESSFVQDSATSENIVVHIAGQVENEGIIELPFNSRVNDAVREAGGLTAEADLSSVNLADILNDGQKIYIPSKDEVNNGYNIEIFGNYNYSNEFMEVGKVNINTANQSDFETLPGIGPSTALKIINYRKENGNFSNIDEIMNVPGIGQAKYDGIKDIIIVN